MPKKTNGDGNGKHPLRQRGAGGDERHSEPLSTRETDSAEFRAKVQEEARLHLGGTIEEMVSDPDLREVLYAVFATGLRREPRPISPEMMETVNRLRAAGLVVTPGAGPQYLPKPLNLGVSLSDAILEERYGTG
ncbi:MAG TPA: hypothetical protein VF771_16235 [Longimicrobiaceae bacterium]